MVAREVHDKPSDVSAEQGEVIVDGPNGVAVSLTPEAARETSSRLSRAADEAASQQRQSEAADGRPGSPIASD